ncbi:MAG: folate family ECF transporter S component [Christensenella sp.]|nr:folate family ECF transporter S component [Christensenella sp.]
MKHITPKRLSLMAMLIALQIVLSKFLMLQLTGSIRLSIDSVPILLSGIWFGPLAGGIVGLLSDLLGTLLFPTAGMYYPPLTAAFVLIGVCAGFLAKIVKSNNGLLRAALIVIPAEIVGSYLTKSAALSGLTQLPFSALLVARALPVGSIMIVNTLIVYLLDRLLASKVMGLDAASSASIVEGSEQLSPIQSYSDALDYIHHVTWRGSRLGLERTRELLDRMGNPQQRLKFIHVAGTNGKGSTCAMLANTLKLAGYKTGLYISPFITRFNERMQVNGVSVGDGELAQITEFVRPHAEAMADHPTEFELITAIAVEYFARNHADIVVFEVGMGGALDSTNVIDTPELAIITNIGLDHTRELGPTISDIARAKAGIIKPGGDVLIYDQNPEADAVFQAACRKHGAKLYVTDHSRISNVSATLTDLSFACAPYGQLHCSLVGSYQTKNAAVAITALEILRSKGWQISDQNLRDGLVSVRWPARFELLGHDPIFVADGGHNPQGVSAVVESLRLHFPDRKITFLIGVMADKDVLHMVEQIGPIANEFVTVTPNNPRAMNATELANLLRQLGYTATACDSVESGVELAIARAGKSGIVCALGSLYMLGDVRSALGVN